MELCLSISCVLAAAAAAAAAAIRAILLPLCVAPLPVGKVAEESATVAVRSSI
jgi:hypothetical protein